MEFISTKDLKNENAPKGQVLVQYLEPSWGGFSIEFGIAYFDNPLDYEDELGQGWLLWLSNKEINVIAYAELPNKIVNSNSLLSQEEFIQKHKSFYPNLGNIGE